MAINLAQKFESKTSDLLKVARKTKGMTNQDWDWDGVNAINVYTLTDPTINDYTTNGANRYGNPSEVEDTLQTWTLSRDRSWTKTIDKKNSQDTMAVRKPGAYLAQVLKNKMVPEIDTYILSTIATAGAVADRDDIATDAASSASNAYTNFLLINADITNNEAPTEGRVAGMTATYYNYLKQTGFVLDSDSAYKGRQTGNLGTVDGVDVVIIPSGRMPSTTGAIDLLITHPMVTVAPEKLVDYTLQKNPQGISGDVLEYRHRYDAFCDTNKINAVGMHAVA
jgi:hypothetical protein